LRAGAIVIFHVRQQQVTEVALAEHNTWSRHSLRIEPINLSAYPFCQGSAARSVDRECPSIEAFG
jgi:hypothetical protein